MSYIYYIFADVTKLDDGKVGIVLNITNNLGKEMVSESGIFNNYAEYKVFATGDECGHKMLQSGMKAFLATKYPSKGIKTLLEQTKNIEFYSYKLDDTFYVDLASRYSNLSNSRQRHWAFMERVGEHNSKVREDVMNAIRNNKGSNLKIFITDIFNIAISNIDNIKDTLPMFKFSIKIIDINVQSITNFSQLFKVEIIEFN